MRWPSFIFTCACVAWGGVSLASDRLPDWKPGVLEIHHVSTGRGNATFILGPDGTSIMVDAGESATDPRYTSGARPSAEKRAGEWIARYVQRHLARANRTDLDYFVATHLHPDHVGAATAASPSSPCGRYVLSGLTDLAAVVPIRRLIDRGFPDYRYPSEPVTAAFARNYLAFVRARQERGEACERFLPGRSDQIELVRQREIYPTFFVRNLAANGLVWSGASDIAQQVFPELSSLAPPDRPNENMCSIAFRLSYGRFDYYTGGDLSCDDADGEQPWRDIETVVARRAGPVEVAVANHHGYFDAVGANSVRSLRPRIWVVPAWHVTHPGIAQLERMLSERLYAGPRDVFITSLAPAAALLNQRFLPRVASTQGHIVIRVESGGDTYTVYVTSDSDESDTVLTALGPLRSQEP